MDRSEVKTLPTVENVVTTVSGWRKRMEPFGFKTPSLEHTMCFIAEEAGEVAGAVPRQSDEYIRRNNKNVKEENEVLDWLMMAATGLVLLELNENCLRSGPASIASKLLAVTASAMIFYERDQHSLVRAELKGGMEYALEYLGSDAIQKLQARLDEREREVIRRHEKRNT